MNELLQRFKTSLADLGVTAETRRAAPSRLGRPGVESTTAKLTRGASTQRYALLYGPAVKATDTIGAHDAELPTLVFTDFVAPSTASTFRRSGVQFLDTAGNAWIEFGDVLIEVRGRTRPADLAAPTRGASNLFSSSRAQVVFALLAWPRLWDAPQREIAEAAGVSLGQAHNTLGLLSEAGYGSDRSRAHHGGFEMLDLWTAAFPAGLAKKLLLASYSGKATTVTKVHADDPVFTSGEAAANKLLRPASMTLYVEELDPKLAIVNKWRSDGPANIVVRRKFWQAPDDSDLPRADVRPAPWPLVYADLKASDDPRVRNVATEWRDRFARLGQGS